jgi:thymidylate synthase (FAD)
MYNLRGELSPNFVDGSSPDRQMMYSRCEGKEFIREALRVGNYICARCFADKTKDNPLNVHHLKPWAGNPLLRFELSNVVVLCRKCHRYVHSKNNTTKEFIK